MGTRTVSFYPGWVVLHLPHDATDIPAEVRDQFLLDDRELGREVLRMTDHRTADLFGAHCAAGHDGGGCSSWSHPLRIFFRA